MTEAKMDQILIIDDDVALCELVTEYLEPLGFEVTTAHRGDAGAERALKDHPVNRRTRCHASRD